ncbi:hypothetical protein NKG94_18945 [Micromonospora sp. M12]
MASTYGGGRLRRITAATAVTAAGLLLWPGTAYAADVTTTRARRGRATRCGWSSPFRRSGPARSQADRGPVADRRADRGGLPDVCGRLGTRISARTLDKPVAGIHSSGVTTVTTAVTWVRVGESEPGPARLALSMGPMPQAERLTFEVVRRTPTARW